MTKRYSELILLPTFEERFDYLKLSGSVCDPTFAGHRWLNQIFYNSNEYKRFRREIMVRDQGCDLGLEGYEIKGRIYIHHIEPITLEDLQLKRLDKLLSGENAISVSFNTHQAIHYGDKNLLFTSKPIERRPNDTCPWR